MTSLVAKLGSVLVLEPGERLRCAAYVGAIDSAGRRIMGPSVVAVSDRRFLFAPRSAFLSSSAWADRRLDAVRVATTGGWFGLTGGRRFEVDDGSGPVLRFELRDRKEAAAFRTALSGRIAS